MPSFDSDKVDKCLRRKMKAEVKASGDNIYTIYNDAGEVVAKTAISKGSKDDLGPKRISQMAGQLHLKTQEFVELINCTLSRDDALEKMQEN